MPPCARNSVNCCDRNSPTFSVCMVPTTRVGTSRPALRSAVKLAINWRSHVQGGFVFVFEDMYSLETGVVINDD
eukprot:750459-Pleurochrysis_carterae.AAC.1